MPYVGKLVHTRSPEACARSYSILRTTNLYFASQNAFTQPTAKSYVTQLFAQAPQAKSAVQGKLAVVTGVTIGGAGYHMAEELALQAGMHVVLLSRNETKLQAAAAAIEQTAQKRGVEKPTLYETAYDLDSLASAKKAADFVIDLAQKKYGRKLHVLVNNAGAVVVDPTLTKDGIEANAGRNHVCPHYFTELLIPTLKAAATAEYKPRVVDVASMGHAMGTDFDPQRLMEFPKQGGAPEGLIVEKDDSTIEYGKGSGPIPGPLQYGRAKMGIVASIQHLQKLHPEINFTSQQPGSIASNFGASLGVAGYIYYYGFYFFQYSPSQGAVTVLRAALDPDFNTEADLQGAYLHADSNPWTPASPTAVDPVTNKVYTWESYAKDCYECTEKLIAKVHK